MSTGIEKGIIDIGAMEAINKTIITGRKLLKTHIEKDQYIESDYNDDDIDFKLVDVLDLNIYYYVGR